MKWLVILLLLLSIAPNTLGEDIVVVVNQSNDTPSLSKSQVIDIFLGRYVAFPDGEPAKPVDIAEEALKADFYQRLTNLNIARINAYWSRIKFTGKARKPEEMESESEAIKYLETNTQAIGYIKATSLTDDLKVIYVINE